MISNDNIIFINYENHTWQCWSNVNNRMSEYIADTPDTIINTSCEHIENFDNWYSKVPNDRLMILQTNDYFEIDDHINCVKNINEFQKMCPLSKELYSGVLNLDQYNRFMLIGYR